ncbi:MAG: hypothetical protein N4A53_07125 [Pelagimonas sp.]|jgi:hypothetical protein|nr:hypothetical protein [Pelagimonas sp.]
MSASVVNLSLTRAEAVVLFEFLSKISDEQSYSVPDASELSVCDSIVCSLEQDLWEPFAENYKEILTEAKLLIVAE